MHRQFKSVNDVLPIILCFLLIAAGAAIGAVNGLAYKRGQIDAAKGIQHYHPSTQPSNEAKWVWKD